jgi:Acyl-CoA reductase (LuxC)
MTGALERVEALVLGARRIADAADPLGKRARAELAASSGLSPAGVRLALERCLEIRPSDAELSKLCASVPAAPRAHVLLSANVFVAAHRALALALAASEKVFVRPSRREPLFVQLLNEAAPGLFSIVPELAPAADEHVFAYGSDETLADLRRNLPRGVVLHAHGSGFGVAILDLESGAERDSSCQKLALDVAAFDQRGCLSPRLVFVRGSTADIRATAVLLAEALAQTEAEIPRGELSAAEQADIVRYRDSAGYAATLLPAGLGFVSSDETLSLPLILPPVGRNLHVLALKDAAAQLGPFAAQIAAIGLAARSDLATELERVLPAARRSVLGQMQRPPFDGPVDLRVSYG